MEKIKKNRSQPCRSRVVPLERRKRISETLKRKGIRPPSRKGIPNSEEQKMKISKKLKGRKMSREAVEKSRIKRIGQKRSKKTRERISEFMTGRTGNLSHNWQGGITPERKRIRNSIQSQLWRESIFARDNWTCQKCGKRGGKLHAHHVYNFADYPELRFAIDNGITFCKDCHRKFHKIYGKKNNTKEQLEEFLDL